MKAIIVKFLTLIVMGVCSIVQAQTEPDPDWPCIQVLIPKMSAASIWDGPPVDELEPNQTYAQLARTIVTSVVDGSESLSEQQLDDYLRQVDAEQPNIALTYLFGEFLDRFNTKRSTQINTIKRYTKTQRTSADTIQALTDQIAELQDQPDQHERIAELESELHWQKRMFSEREKSFKYLCEIPQQIYQQAGEVARMISMKLEY